MEADLTSFRQTAEAGWSAPPDFSALIAFLAAAQATQPTARAAARLDAESGGTGEVAAALTALFAPTKRGKPSASAILEGRFNPAVPFSNVPVTPFKPT